MAIPESRLYTDINKSEYIFTEANNPLKIGELGYL
jgi:hypothetical protein